MSADNMHAVSKLHGKLVDQYGIFELADSAGYRDNWFNLDNAIQVYSYAVPAILAAHILEKRSPTEYGVSVDDDVLVDVHVTFDDRPLGWGYIK
jgi:hypothetical protein